MSKRKKANSLKDNYLSKISQTSNISRELSNYIQFNFKYYNFSDKASQSFEDWQDDKILADLNNKLYVYSGQTIDELKSMDKLVIYGDFPENSDFKEPECFKNINVKWARFRLTGRRRLVGVFIPSDDTTLRNIFYVVYLDKNHRFYKIEKY